MLHSIASLTNAALAIVGEIWTAARDRTVPWNAHLILDHHVCDVTEVQQNRPQEALDMAQRGLSKTPDYVDLIDTRGMAYYRLGRYDEAVKDFNRCLRLYPNRAPAVAATYFHLGRCLADIGEKSQAIEHLNRSLELNKEFQVLNDVEIKEVYQLLAKLSGGEN